ncbi:MAG: superoxide dismutase family protein [Pseudomonadota bacterium]|nr:superoxide dismutase family protein [Pseudomonadota bacterium]
MRIARLSLITFAAAGIAACGTTPEQPAPEPVPVVERDAVANLASASGSLVSGRLQVMTMGANAVHFTGEIGGLAPGSTHGFHVHEKGDCSAADASSAGGHFNPAGNPHGRMDEGAHHAGDIDNIVADAEGVARVNMHVPGLTLGTGAANDAAGRAIIVHADPDDYASQPSGNAGKRIACGVITIVQ